MAIVYRDAKGSDLTPEEVDNNFLTLDEGKVDKSTLNNNNTMLIKDDAGNLVELEIDFNRIVGRLATGEIIALTTTQLKGLLAIAQSDVTGLVAALAAKADSSAMTTALAGKSDTGHTHAQADITGLVAALAAKQAAITPNAGWGNPTGTGSKALFDTGTVLLTELAGRVKSLIDTLKAQGILAD